MRILTILLVIALLAGCGQEYKAISNSYAEKPSVYMASMSDDGLAVAIDSDEIIVNDSGKSFSIKLHNIAGVVSPSKSGVWVGVDGYAYFISRHGHMKFATDGMPSAIFPLDGESAYVIDGSGLSFIGVGNSAMSHRSSWSAGEGEGGNSFSSRDTDYGISIYDR